MTDHLIPEKSESRTPDQGLTERLRQILKGGMFLPAHVDTAIREAADRIEFLEHHLDRVLSDAYTAALRYRDEVESSTGSDDA